MTVGVLGGGQLGRMLAQAGAPLGLSLRFLDESSDACAGQLAPLTVCSFERSDEVEQFATGLEVATFEFENVPVSAAEHIARLCPLHPSVAALAICQDRLLEKQAFEACGLRVAEYRPLELREELDRAIHELGLPLVMKTRRFGYDGKGQVVLRSSTDADNAWHFVGGGRVPLIAERFVEFRRELSLIAVRSARSVEPRFYPLTENVHVTGILRQSTPLLLEQNGPLQAAAQSAVGRLLEHMQYVGVLAVEFFEVDGTLLANEMAPRVHNSGHWTIEGAVCSQFENHLRAILGWPLGDTTTTLPCAMINLIGQMPPIEALLAIDGARVHVYGKRPQPARKLGHVTILGRSSAELAQRVAAVQAVVAAETA